MASKGIFENQSGSREKGAIWQNIANMLNNCEEFALTARSLRYHFTTLMKRYKSKTRPEVKVTGLGDKELSVNEQLLEEPKQILKKRLPYIENEKKKAQEMRKTAMEKIWRDESDTGNKSKVKGIVRKLLVFFKKNLNKITNLYQKICNKKTMKEKLGNDSIISSLYKISKCKLSKVFQQQQA